MRSVTRAILPVSMVLALSCLALPGLAQAGIPRANTAQPSDNAPRLPDCGPIAQRAAFLPEDPSPGCAAPIATDRALHRKHRMRT